MFNCLQLLLHTNTSRKCWIEDRVLGTWKLLKS